MSNKLIVYIIVRAGKLRYDVKNKNINEGKLAVVPAKGRRDVLKSFCRLHPALTYPPPVFPPSPLS